MASPARRHGKRSLLLVALTGCEPTEPQAKETQAAQRVMRVRVVGPSRTAMPGAKLHVGLWAKEPAKVNQDNVCDALGEAKVELPQSVAIPPPGSRRGVCAAVCPLASVAHSVFHRLSGGWLAEPTPAPLRSETS